MKARYRPRWLPLPYHSLLLLVVWLLLHNTLAPGHLLLGTLLALVIPLITVPLYKPHSPMRNPFLGTLYLLRVLGDIIIANLQVARLVLGPVKKLQPGFVAVPLDIQEELPITVLANTVSMTPGTVSSEVSTDRRFLYVHVLHLTDEQALIASIKQRYETPLKEMFRC